MPQNPRSPCNLVLRYRISLVVKESVLGFQYSSPSVIAHSATVESIRSTILWCSWIRIHLNFQGGCNAYDQKTIFQVVGNDAAVRERPRDHSKLMSKRKFCSGCLEILKKRPDINYFSKSSEKLRADIFFGGEGGHETESRDDGFLQ